MVRSPEGGGWYFTVCADSDPPFSIPFPPPQAARTTAAASAPPAAISVRNLLLLVTIPSSLGSSSRLRRRFLRYGAIVGLPHHVHVGGRPGKPHIGPAARQLLAVGLVG